MNKQEITQLPRQTQEQLNLRLQAGEGIPQLVAWLNSLPAAPAALSPNPVENQFSEQDLSAWVQGGHGDWLAHQAVLEAVRQLAPEMTELSQAGQGALTDTLAQCLSGQYVMATRAAIRAAAGQAVDLKTLQPLCRDLVALRQGDHSAERLRFGREKFGETRKDQLTMALELVLKESKQWPEVQDLFRTAFLKLREYWPGSQPDGVAPGRSQ